jgi:hypothetical protein
MAIRHVFSCTEQGKADGAVIRILQHYWSSPSCTVAFKYRLIHTSFQTEIDEKFPGKNLIF